MLGLLLPAKHAHLNFKMLANTFHVYIVDALSNLALNLARHAESLASYFA